MLKSIITYLEANCKEQLVYILSPNNGGNGIVYDAQKILCSSGKVKLGREGFWSENKAYGYGKTFVCQHKGENSCAVILNRTDAIELSCSHEVRAYLWREFFGARRLITEEYQVANEKAKEEKMSEWADKYPYRTVSEGRHCVDRGLGLFQDVLYLYAAI